MGNCCPKKRANNLQEENNPNSDNDPKKEESPIINQDDSVLNDLKNDNDQIYSRDVENYDQVNVSKIVNTSSLKNSIGQDKIDPENQ